VTYEATVPDTLDLAEQARLSLKRLDRNMDPNQFYGVYQGSRSRSRAGPSLRDHLEHQRQKRPHPPLHAGHERGPVRLEVEHGLLRAMLREVRETASCTTRSRLGPPQGTSYPQTNASLMGVILNRQGLDSNAACRSGSISWPRPFELGLLVEDRAFLPDAGGDRTSKASGM